MSSLPKFKNHLTYASVLFVALVAIGYALGRFEAAGLRTAGLLAGAAALVLLLVAVYGLAWRPLRTLDTCREQLSHLATRDNLTGLWDRPNLLEQLKVEIHRAWRCDGPLSVSLVGVDRFGEINEHLGRSGGDSVLRTVGGLVAASARQYDMVGRFDGEQFLAILPATGIEDAARAAERLRHRVEESGFACDGKGLTVTISVGVTQAENDTLETADALIARAADALARARSEGGNRVCATATRSLVDSEVAIPAKQ